MGNETDMILDVTTTNGVQYLLNFWNTIYELSIDNISKATGPVSEW